MAVECVAVVGNKVGELNKIVREIAKKKINIDAISAEGLKEAGIIRIITENNEAVCGILKKLNIPCRKNTVIKLKLKNQPGELAKVTQILAKNKINIDHIYGTAGGFPAEVVLCVDNPSKASKLLKNIK